MLPLATLVCLAVTILPFGFAGGLAHCLLVALAVLALLRALRRQPFDLQTLRETPLMLPWVGCTLMAVVGVCSAARHGGAWITVLVLWGIDAAFNWRDTVAWRRRA